MLLVHYFRFRLRHKSALPMYPMTLHNQLMEIFQHIRWYSLALDYSVYRIVQHAWLSRTMRFQLNFLSVQYIFLRLPIWGSKRCATAILMYWGCPGGKWKLLAGPWGLISIAYRCFQSPHLTVQIAPDVQSNKEVPSISISDVSTVGEREILQMFGSPTMVKSLQWDDSCMMFTIPICETTFVYQRYPGLQSHPLVRTPGSLWLHTAWPGKSGRSFLRSRESYKMFIWVFP